MPEKRKTKNGMNPTHVEQKYVKGLSENYWPVQKKKDDKEEATTQSSNESSNERTQSESETDRNEDKVERKNSKKDQDLDKTTKVERKLSTRSVHYEEDQTKPQFKSGKYLLRN